ncbi:MAG: helix-turn-helix domain-containing protein [Rhodospirillales bacterium]
MSDTVSGPGPGRPPLYRKDFDEQARMLCLLGATNDFLAEFFGVSDTTIDNWIARHATFRDAVRAGRLIADTEAAQGLYQRAIGAEWTEETAVKVRDDQFSEHVEIVKVKKAAPPDTQAASLWLRNRHPQWWREKTTVEVTGDLAERLDAALRRGQG